MCIVNLEIVINFKKASALWTFYSPINAFLVINKLQSLKKLHDTNIYKNLFIITIYYVY